MAVSKPTFLLSKCLNCHYTLNFYLTTLSLDLGCFPFDLRPYRHKSNSSTIFYFPSQFIVSIIRNLRALRDLVINRRHYCNSFRIKPAITRFDWNFSAIYKSSQDIATATGSLLHKKMLQAVHKQIIWFRVLYYLTDAIFYSFSLRLIIITLAS